jgi:uncharacterized membrane protein YhaH (DUF805 family)
MSDNLFAPPTVDLSTEAQAFGEIRFFSPSSRLNRLRYWAHLMLSLFALLIAAGLTGLIANYGSTNLAMVIGGIAYLAFFIFTIIVVVQRLHDIDKSGWWWLLNFVPIANLYLVILVLFIPGTPGPNRFGLKTPPTQTWHWVAALSFPVLGVLIGILAAISIPAYQGYLDRAKQAQTAPVQTP